jgi:hypothetical protein
MMRLPRWATNIVVLIGAYVGVMIAAALWLPHEWDWSVWGWLNAMHPPTFQAGKISIVDVPWDPDDIPGNRKKIALFLTQIVKSPQKPEALILDVQFGTCRMKDCGPQWRSDTDALRASVVAAAAAIPRGVYGLEIPKLEYTVRDGDEATGLVADDVALYGAFTGVGHSKFIPLASGTGLFYRACYSNVPVSDARGNIDVRPVWDIVERVTISQDDFPKAICDGSHVPVSFPDDPSAADQAAIVKLSPLGTFPTDAHFKDKFVVVGTIQYDPGYAALNLHGPELLAWALSDALEPGTRSNAQIVYDTEPQGTKLIALVPTFSILTLIAYIAIFFTLKRRRLGAIRRALPWLAALASSIIGLGTFALFEWWLLETGHIQPQVTLIALGVPVTSALSSLRAHQILFEEQWGINASPISETYDYDVFISYAHDEGAWVSENVYVPLRDARLSSGRKLNVFFDTNSIRYGTAWQDRISLAIDTSRFFIPVYSETYFSREYCRFEVKRAHRKWIKMGEESRCVLPIMRGKPKILGTVDDIQAASIDDVPDLVEQVVAEILQSLSRLEETTTV